MCFSANASFAASAVLAGAGIASVREAKSGRAKFYAAVPFLFAIQQFIEGLQWLSAPLTAWSQTLGYGFLFFALILWPAYIPLAVWLIETDHSRRERLGWFAFFGIVTAVYSAVNLILFPISINAQDCCHIIYGFHLPFPLAVGVAYAIATCGSLFFSSHLWVKAMGLASFVALVITITFARTANVSVWCFACALLSVLIFLHFRSGDKGFNALLAKARKLRPQ